MYTFIFNLNVIDNVGKYEIFILDKMKDIDSNNKKINNLLDVQRNFLEPWEVGQELGGN